MSEANVFPFAESGQPVNPETAFRLSRLAIDLGQEILGRTASNVLADIYNPEQGRNDIFYTSSDGFLGELDDEVSNFYPYPIVEQREGHEEQNSLKLNVIPNRPDSPMPGHLLAEVKFTSTAAPEGVLNRAAQFFHEAPPMVVDEVNKITSGFPDTELKGHPMTAQEAIALGHDLSVFRNRLDSYITAHPNAQLFTDESHT